MVVVILHDGKDLCQCGSRDEDGPNPVVDHRPGCRGSSRGVSRPQLVRNNLAALEPGIGLAAARFAQAIDPEEYAARRQLTTHSLFGKAHVLIKAPRGPRP